MIEIEFNPKISHWIIAGIKRKYDFEGELVLTKIEEILGINVDDIKGKCRKREFVEARYIYAYIMKTKTNYSLSRIARPINRNHDIIIYYNKMFETISKYDKNLFANYYKIINSLTI